MSHIHDNPTKRLVELAGETLADRFILKKLVGQGGYGAVYLAEQLSIGRPCAVKVLVPQVIEAQHNVHRFRREARATSRLEHPNTIVIYDFGVDEKRQLLYIAMEYVDGMSLRDRIAEDGQLPLHDAVWIAHQAAGSLHDAHKMGLVHRDIKPHNIMLTTRAGDSNFAKVIDFGIAKFLDHASIRETLQQVTSTGLVIGTPAYMAPEQVRSLDLDGRADQYALAACVFQMLTGRVMFTGHSAIDVASKQLTHEVPSMRQHNPSIPEEVDHVVKRALSKRREDRYDDILDFTQALAAAAGLALPGETAERSALPTHEATLLEVAAPTTALEEPAVETTEPDAFAETIATDEEQQDAFIGDDTIAVPASDFEARHTEPNAPVLGKARQQVSEQASSQNGPDTVAVSIDDVIQPAEPRVFVQPLIASAFPSDDDIEAEPRRPEEETLGGVKLLTDETSRSGRGRWLLVALIALCVVAAFAAVFGGGGRQTTDAAVAAATEVPTPTEVAQPTEPQEHEVEPSPQPTAVDLVEAAAVPVEPKTKPPAPNAASQAHGVATASESEPPATPTVAKGKGLLDINAVPWGQVYVNGENLGDGPYKKVVVPPGRHTVELYQQGRSVAGKTVDVKPSKSTMVKLIADP